MTLTELEIVVDLEYGTGDVGVFLGNGMDVHPMVFFFFFFFFFHTAAGLNPLVSGLSNVRSRRAETRVTTYLVRKASVWRFKGLVLIISQKAHRL